MALRTRYLTTTLFFAICILGTIDTHLFVYPSLSRSLLMEIGWIILALRILAHCIIKKTIVDICKQEIFIIVFIGFVAVHGFVCGKESYRTMYLCTGLGGILCVSQALKQKLLTKHDIQKGLLIILVLNLCFIALESLHIISSNNLYFKITGANENPTVTAEYMAACTPLLIGTYHSSKHKKVITIFLALTVCCIFLLRCRTAYIGMGIATACLIGCNEKFRCWIKRTKGKHIVIGLSAIALIATSSTLYHAKKDSADGRFLIWKLSAKMIVERPWGHGYGMFEKSYNEKQSLYFANGQGSTQEQRNASFTAMSYNDYLEHGVDGGIIGMLFLVAFYTIFIIIAKKKSLITEFSIITSLAAMSLFNFVYVGVSLWIMIACIVGIIIGTKENSYNIQIKHNTLIIFLAFVGYMGYNLIHVIYAQTQLYQIQQKMQAHVYVNDLHYKRIEKEISTSEAFWYQRARNAIKNKEYKLACACLDKANHYTSMPRILLNLYDVKKRLGEEDQAIKHIITYSNMCPNKLLPRVFLMRYYNQRNEINKAVIYARSIVEIEQKVYNPKAISFKREAMAFLNVHK